MDKRTAYIQCFSAFGDYRKVCVHFLWSLFVLIGLTAPCAGAENKSVLAPHIKRLILTEQFQQLEPELRKLAMQGNAEGQYQLGILYLHGNGVKENDQMALYWFEKSARQHHTKAQFNSAILLVDEKRNRQKAIIYLQSAAASGHKMAEMHLKYLTLGSEKNKGMDQSTLNSRLIYAAKKGDSEEVSAWINAGAAPNSTDRDGRTALILAVENGNIAALTVLLNAGADVLLTDSTGNTALHFAVITHNRKIVKPLAASGNLEQKNQQGLTALLLAIELNDANLVAELLLHGSNANAVNRNSAGAIDIAQRKSNKAIVDLLKQYGAKSATTDKKELIRRLAAIQAQLKQPQFESWDELMLAASTGDYEMVDWLLIEDSPDKNSYKTGKAITQSVISNNKKTTDLLLNHLQEKSIANADIREIINLAIVHYGLEWFSHLYQHPLLHEAKNLSAGKLLMQSITEGKPDIAIYLIQQGGKLNYVSENGESHLITASKRDQSAVVKKLLAMGVAVDDKDHLGRTALWHSAYAGHQKITKLLISNSADIDLSDQQGRTVLMMAVFNNDDKLVGLLLRSGASLDKVSKNGNTPLHMAAKKSSPQIITLLLEKKADLSQRNSNSLTPLMVAAQADNELAVKLLLIAGADPDRKNQNGRSAIDMANNQKIVTLLKEYQ